MACAKHLSNKDVDQRIDDTAQAPADAKSVEASLKALWDKTKRAGELIAELRTERTTLQRKLQELEQELGTVRTQLGQREEMIKKLVADASKMAPKEDVLFTDGERQALTTKVKELLAKIEGYL